MLHIGNPAYANRNGILTRLLASFPLLCTTSSNVLCSKFGGEMLWIFKIATWTHNRCTKINKSPTGVRASSFEIWTANLAITYPRQPNKLTELHLQRFKLEILLSQLPCGRPYKTWYSDEDISDLGKRILNFIFERKHQNPLDIQKQCICKLGKTKWAETLYLVFIDFQSCISSSFESYFPSQGM